jgi:soluble lytic murein transglycosylase-like protein
MVNRMFIFCIGLTGYFHGALHAEPTCIDQTSTFYGIPAKLINAIIRTESNFDARAVNTNANGSEDVGLMQINSEWLPRIAGLGYDRESLFNPCINIMVGGWILAQEIERFGYSWEAVGSYNAGPSIQRADRRAWYAQRVAYHLR